MSSLSSLLCSLCILAWGVAVSRLPAALAMSVVFFALALSPIRVSISAKTRQRINEGSFLIIGVAAVWYWLVRQTLPTSLGLHYVAVAPLYLYPRLLARALCQWDLAPGEFNANDGVAWARDWAQKARGGSLTLDSRPSMDFQLSYLLICAFSASVTYPEPWSLGLSAVAVCAVCALRAQELLPPPQRGPSPYLARVLAPYLAPFMALLAGSLIGLVGGVGINAGLSSIESQMSSWWSHKGESNWSTLMADTRIGKTGQASGSSKLLYRLEWSEGSGYLRRGVYPSTLDGTFWKIAGAGQGGERALFPNSDGSFSLSALNAAPSSTVSAPASPPRQAKIAANLTRDRMALPLPIGASDIFTLPVSKININAMGAASVAGAAGFVKFGALFNPDHDTMPAPDSGDTRVPEALIPALDAFIEEAGLKNLPPEQTAERIKSHFANHWRYTLNLTTRSGKARSLSDFLTTEREGHCEYFASATALTLRRLGVPARYASGFLVSEYDQSEQVYWIREKHSHAWTHYWSGSRWLLVDSTVAGSEEPESLSDQASDFFSRLQYRMDQLDPQAWLSHIDPRWLYAFALALASWLGYKLWKSNKKRAPKRAPTPSERLVATVEIFFNIQRQPQESSSDFWRRAAPLSERPELLMRAAEARERALFHPPGRGEPDQSPVADALSWFSKQGKEQNNRAESG